MNTDALREVVTSILARIDRYRAMHHRDLGKSDLSLPAPMRCITEDEEMQLRAALAALDQQPGEPVAQPAREPEGERCTMWYEDDQSRCILPSGHAGPCDMRPPADRPAAPERKERACRDCGSLIETEEDARGGAWCIECNEYVHTKPWTARTPAPAAPERLRELLAALVACWIFAHRDQRERTAAPIRAAIEALFREQVEEIERLSGHETLYARQYARQTTRLEAAEREVAELRAWRDSLRPVSSQPVMLGVPCRRWELTTEDDGRIKAVWAEWASDATG